MRIHGGGEYGVSNVLVALAVLLYIMPAGLSDDFLSLHFCRKLDLDVEFFVGLIDLDEGFSLYRNYIFITGWFMHKLMIGLSLRCSEIPKIVKTRKLKPKNIHVFWFGYQ